MSYLEIIKAKREVIDAAAELARLEKKRKEDACIEAFKEFRDIWNEVKDMKVADFRHYGTKITPFHEQLALPYSFQKEELKKTTLLGFYNGGGNHGDTYCCEWHEESAQVVFMYYYGTSGAKKYMTKQELMDKFIEFLATRIPK